MAAALALFTSLSYGLSNWIGPRLARGAPLYLLLILGQTCSFVLAGIIVLATGDAAPGADELGFAALAGLGNAFGLILFYRAAEVGPLSIVTPIGSMGAGVPVAAGLASGEDLVVLEGIGIALAMIGLFLAARRPNGPPDAAAPVSPPTAAIATPDADASASSATAAREHHLGRAVVLSLLAALCFGTFLAAMAPAAESSAGWAVFASRASLLVVLVGVAGSTGALVGAPPKTLPLLAVPGLLLFAGTISYSAATRLGELSVVSVLGSLFTVVTVSLALLVDRERLTGTQAVGVLATIVGVVLISAR